jgi:hypothetical protein
MLVKPHFLLLEIHVTILEDGVKLDTDDIDKYGSSYPGTFTTDDDDYIYFVIKLATRDCFKRLCKVGVLKCHDKCGNKGCFEHNTFCATQDETYSECGSANVQYFRNYFMVR